MLISPPSGTILARLGTNLVIADALHIGHNCVIGANSVVISDIPDCCVAVGISAKVI